MRKITLFASFATMAGMAFAAAPVVSQSVAKSETVKGMRVEQIAKNGFSVKADAQSRADGETETPANGTPNFYTPGGFYTGTSNQWYGASDGTCVMLAPARGVTKFVPFSTYTNSRWSWEEYVVNEAGTGLEPEAYYFDADTLEYPNFPYTQWASFMTLTASDNAYTCPKVVGALFGRNTEEWGLSSETQGMYGVCPLSTGTYGSEKPSYIWGGYFGFDKTDTDANANGVYNALLTGANPAFPEAEYSDVKLAGYVTSMPSPGAWYQLSDIYFLCRSVNSADIAINVTVYEVDENDEVSDKPVGKGSAIIPANTAAAPFYDFLTVNLTGLNILGYSTNRPICSNKELYILIDGMTGDEVTSFYMMVNSTATIPDAEWTAQNYWRKMFPTHAQTMFSMTEIATGKTVVEPDPFIHAFYADQENIETSDLALTTDFYLYYNLTFPQVFDAYTGSDEFEANVDNGPVAISVDSDYDLAQLYSDGIINAYGTGEWFNYEVAYNDEEKFTVVTVSADALPAGMTGRTGFINFSGYACDFTIKVVQGDGSVLDGINEVKNVAAGAAEYFDLQGRKLNAAPAKGLYIERNGSAAATKLAR